MKFAPRQWNRCFSNGDHKHFSLAIWTFIKYDFYFVLGNIISKSDSFNFSQFWRFFFAINVTLLEEKSVIYMLQLGTVKCLVIQR